MITAKTAKALQILVDAGKPICARDFAEKMWPESKGWDKYHNIGYGATRGSGMWLSAGSYLSKLYQRKLVMLDFTGSNQKVYTISRQGREALDEIHNLHQGTE
jgi:hypothetical protein